MTLVMNLNVQQRKRLHQIVLVTTFGGLLFGYDTGVINGALSSLKENMGLTPSSEGLIMGVLLIGAALGSLFGGKLGDHFGRRKYLLCLSFIFFTGALLSAAAPDLTTLLVARFFLGYAVGGASLSAPAFISEVAPTEMRGRLTGFNELAIVIGQLIAFAINAFIGYFWGHLPEVWRYMLLVQALPAIGLLVGMWRCPESPRWLISKNRGAEGLAILRQIRPAARAQQEYEEIVALVELENKNSVGLRGSLAAVFQTRWMMKLLLIGIIWGAIQQTTGINVIMYYGTEVLKTAGFSEKTALIVNVSNGVATIGGMLIGVMLLVDRLSRRMLSGLCFGLIAVIHIVIFFADSYLTGDAKAITIWLLGLLFVVVMCSGVGFLTWVVMAELFPLRYRGLMMGIAVFFHWLANAAVSYCFPLLQAKLGLGPVFLILAGINCLALLFVATLMPETAKKSLEQLEEELATAG